MKIKLNKILNKIMLDLLSCIATKHEAEQLALWMLQELTGKTEIELLVNENIILSEDEERKLNKWIRLRVDEQMPIQYIFGHVPFLDLDLYVDFPILIPRQETEEWVSILIKKLKSVCNEKLNILDIGTGSGCIALSLAKALPNSTICSVDINEKAINLAAKNAEHNNIKNVFFLKSNFYSNISDSQRFDLIVSNPPYISDKQWNDLDKVVRHWEDYKALVADSDGFAAFYEIIANAKDFLNKDTVLKKNNCFQLVLELGRGQENKIVDFLWSKRFYNILVFKDLNGINRWVGASF